MSKINNFGITEDDIIWRAKYNYIIEDDAIQYEYANTYRGITYGIGVISGRGYIDGSSFYNIDPKLLSEINGAGNGSGDGDGHNYNCFREEGECVGYGSGDGSGDTTGICVA